MYFIQLNFSVDWYTKVVKQNMKAFPKWQKSMLKADINWYKSQMNICYSLSQLGNYLYVHQCTSHLQGQSQMQQDPTYDPGCV